jgi:rubrerythrin
MKSVHKYMNEYTGALLDTPAEAIESERETLKEIAKPHWKCKSCNMIISDDNTSKKICSWCGHDMARMHPDDVAEIYQEKMIPLTRDE